MKKFTCVQDIGDLKSALAEAFEIKKERFKYVELGRNKTLMMIFFNSSLRTRLSTQKAAINLGMNVMVLDINQGAWKLETERGVIMDGDKPEHILEAIPVMGCYCDIIGVRSFARFEDRDFDYHPILRTSCLFDGSGNTPPIAELCRSNYHRGIQENSTSQSSYDLGSSSTSIATGCS